MNLPTAEEAFKLLGVGPDCTEAELQKAYHRLSRENHPDMGSGNPEIQARLNEARKVATAHITDHRALIPVELKRAIQEFDQRLVVDQAARQAQEIVTSAVRKQRAQTRPLKYIAFVLAALAAAMGWLNENVLPHVLDQLPIGFPAGVRDGFKVVALVLVVAGALLHLFSERQAMLLEAFKESLDDIDICARNLAQLLDFQDVKEIRQGAIRDYPYRTKLFQLSILRLFDPIDRKRLLIAKGLEHGLLEALGPKNVIPASARLFKVSFTPSLFEPKPELPRPPPPPLPIGVNALMILFTAGIGAGFALWSHSLAPSGWQYLLDAFAILFFLTMVGGFFALGEALLKRKRDSQPE